MAAGERIAGYPDFSEVTLGMREVLEPLFRGLAEGVSEFTFAGIYLFRDVYGYGVSALPGGLYAVTGEDPGGEGFFMLPFGLPEENLLEELFDRFGTMKCVTEVQAGELRDMGFEVSEDRDNFDYLYRREDLEKLSGRKYHRKKNLVNYFTGNYNCEGRPLVEEYLGQALDVLEGWRGERDDPGDYAPAREALEAYHRLGLCGGIYFVEGEAAAYFLGEELRPDMFALHFQKALRGYKGLYQFVNQSFASILPEEYVHINMEQDLGDPGLRKAKESYRPAGFVKKYRARRG